MKKNKTKQSKELCHLITYYAVYDKNLKQNAVTPDFFFDHNEIM